VPETLVREFKENGVIAEVLGDSKGDGHLHSVAIFNVTGQTERSVRDATLTRRERWLDPVDKGYFQSAPFMVFVISENR
jgi:hypothetical protein